MKLNGGNSGIVIPKSDQQVIDMFLGGFFAYLRNNGIPTPDKGLCRFIVYMNLFSDFKELVKQNLENERQQMTHDIMAARNAFNLYHQAQGIPAPELEAALKTLREKYAPAPQQPAGNEPETKVEPEPENEGAPTPAAEMEEEKETPENVIPFPGDKEAE